MLDTTFSVNHVGYNDSGAGKHKFMQMPEQASAPSTAANEGALYTKDDGSTTALYFRQESSGSEIKLTGSTPSAAANGYTFLPGGLLLQWGVVNSPGTSGTVTFATANIAFPANLYNVQLTVARTGSFGSSPSAGIAVVNSGSAFNNTTFSYLCSTSGNARLYWSAIGN